MDDHLILVTRFQHFPQLLDLLLHSLGFLQHTLDTPYVGLEVLVHVKLLVEFESLERLLKFACFFIEIDSIWVEDKDVWRILHPRFMNANFRATTTRFVVGYFVTVCLFPVIREPSVLDIDENRPHLLLMFADDLFLASLLVEQLGHCNVRAKKVLIDCVHVL